jgi:LemA protein
MSPALVFVSVVGLVITGALVVMTVTIWNGLVALKNQVDRSWANIDVILKQRFDELPSLIEVIEQYVQHEKAVIAQLALARQHYGQAKNISEKMAASNEMGLALKGVIAIGEAYPELRSSDHFLQLQSRVSDLEDQIADRREQYNDCVTNLNTRILQIPDVIFANMLGFKEMPLYEISVTEKVKPSLKMKIAS